MLYTRWQPDVVLIVVAVEARAAAEAAGLVMQQVASTGRVSALSKVLVVPAIEATLTVPSLWAPSLGPGLPTVAVVEIVEAGAAAEVARPVMQLTGKVPVFLAEVLSGLAGEV